MLHSNVLILSTAPAAMPQGRPAVVALIIGGGVVVMAVASWLLARRTRSTSTPADRAPLTDAVVRAPSADVRPRTAAALAMPEVDEEVDEADPLAEPEPETVPVTESPAPSAATTEPALDASAVEPLPSPLPVEDDDDGGDLTVLLRRQV